MNRLQKQFSLDFSNLILAFLAMGIGKSLAQRCVCGLLRRSRGVTPCLKSAPRQLPMFRSVCLLMQIGGVWLRLRVSIGVHHANVLVRSILFFFNFFLKDTARPAYIFIYLLIDYSIRSLRYNAVGFSIQEINGKHIRVHNHIKPPKKGNKPRS